MEWVDQEELANPLGIIEPLVQGSLSSPHPHENNQPSSFSTI